MPGEMRQQRATRMRRFTIGILAAIITPSGMARRWVFATRCTTAEYQAPHGSQVERRCRDEDRRRGIEEGITSAFRASGTVDAILIASPSPSSTAPRHPSPVYCPTARR